MFSPHQAIAQVGSSLVASRKVRMASRGQKQWISANPWRTGRFVLSFLAVIGISLVPISGSMVPAGWATIAVSGGGTQFCPQERQPHARKARTRIREVFISFF